MCFTAQALITGEIHLNWLILQCVSLQKYLIWQIQQLLTCLSWLTLSKKVWYNSRNTITLLLFSCFVILSVVSYDFIMLSSNVCAAPGNRTYHRWWTICGHATLISLPWAHFPHVSIPLWSSWSPNCNKWTGYSPHMCITLRSCHCAPWPIRQCSSCHDDIFMTFR